MSISIKDRIYYFSQNLLAFIINIIILPFLIINIIISWFIILIYIDGSTQLTFPWEWDDFWFWKE